MANWESYSDSKFLKPAIVTAGGFANIKITVAYQLFVDNTDQTDPDIRIDITYCQFRATAENTTVGDGYWNAAFCGWFLGNHNKLFDQDQYNKNNQTYTKEINGIEYKFYSNDFYYPYKPYGGDRDSGYISGSYESLPTSWKVSISDCSSLCWNNNPLFGITIRDDLTSFTSSNTRWGRYASDISGGGSALCVMFGEAFSKSDRFSGNNQNGQPKLYIDGSNIIVASSALQHGSTILTYSNENNYDISTLSPRETYTGDEAIASIHMKLSKFTEYGLYQLFDEKTVTDLKINSIDDPYIVHGWIPAVCYWERVYHTDSTGSYSLLKRDSSAIDTIDPKYSLPSIPSYDEPDPVLGIDDHTVFRLKSKDDDGKQFFDTNKNPINKWVRCLKIGAGA